jgi:hypothetical protein
MGGAEGVPIVGAAAYITYITRYTWGGGEVVQYSVARL